MADYLNQLMHWLFVGLRADVFFYFLLWLTTPTDKFCEFIQNPFGIAVMTIAAMLYVMRKMHEKETGQSPIRIVVHREEVSQEPSKKGE